MEKKCPYCAETIQAEAVLCRYCGKDLPNRRCPICAEKIGGETICPHCETNIGPAKQVQDNKSISPGVAAVLSFFIPGLGQIFNKKIAGGMLVLVGSACSAMLTFQLILTGNPLRILAGGMFTTIIWISSMAEAMYAAQGDTKRSEQAGRALYFLSIAAIPILIFGSTWIWLRDSDYWAHIIS